MRTRLAPDRRTLDRAYKAARKEKWRRQLTTEWVSLGGEGWPSVSLRYRLGATTLIKLRSGRDGLRLDGTGSGGPRARSHRHPDAALLKERFKISS